MDNFRVNHCQDFPEHIAEGIKYLFSYYKPIPVGYNKHHEFNSNDRSSSSSLTNGDNDKFNDLLRKTQDSSVFGRNVEDKAYGQTLSTKRSSARLREKKIIESSTPFPSNNDSSLIDIGTGSSITCLNNIKKRKLSNKNSTDLPPALDYNNKSINNDQ